MLSLRSKEQLALQHAVRASVICTCTLALLLACKPPMPRCEGSDMVARGYGCGSSQPTDYSGWWNETDARKVARKMIGGGMLKGEWLQHWETNHEGRPTVMIGPIRNKTTQDIDEEIFITDIERNLVNSGKVRFVRFWNERKVQLRCGGGLRCGRTEPPHVKKKEAPEHAAERGADRLLLGTINSTVQDTLQGDKGTLLYTVTLKLVNVATNEEAWSSEKEIKKIVRRSTLSR